MSRRETIIVALLVNVALLIVLFATAVRSDEAKRESKGESVLAKAPAVKADKALPVASVPAADSLENYATALPTLAETTDHALCFTEELKLAFAPSAVSVEEQAVPAKLEAAKGDRATVEVVVKKGDFLEKIATANQTTVAAIMQANHLTSTQLKIGQLLKVPTAKGRNAPQKATAPATSDEAYYIVREGDNPWLIASRNNLRLDDLLRLNGLDEQKARRLRPGDRLKIR